MVHALHMLHEFSPKPNGASEHLKKMFNAGLISEQVRDSLDYVINDMYVQNILSFKDSKAAEKEDGSEEIDFVQGLEPAWKWFQGELGNRVVSVD